MKSQINDTVLVATPIFTTPSFAGNGDPADQPLYQAFVGDGQVTIWIVNPGKEITDLPVQLLSDVMASSPIEVGDLAPNGDESWKPSDTLTLGFTADANGVSFLIDSISAQAFPWSAFPVRLLRCLAILLPTATWMLLSRWQFWRCADWTACPAGSRLQLYCVCKRSGYTRHVPR